MDDLFGVPLRADPAVALAPFRSMILEPSGPIHRVQFVIELVGPRSVPAYTASMLLDPGWYSALGQPVLWCMSPSDPGWRPLTDSRDGSYDSLGLSWDLVTPQGCLTSKAASHLLSVAERFGQSCDRRAFPLPLPEDVDGTVRRLQTIVEEMDAGMGLLVVSRHGAISEKEAWIACAALGLEFDSTQGAFIFRDQDTGLPLFFVTPSTDESFSLGNVQTGRTHQALMVGFPLVASPAPAKSAELCLLVADHLAKRLYAEVQDEQGLPMTDVTRKSLMAAIQNGTQTLGSLGIAPGSRAARVLWPDHF